MKIAFLNLRDGVSKNEFPNLGLLYLAAVIRKEGHSVRLFDATALGRSLDKIEVELISFKPDVCAVTLYTEGILVQYDFIRKLKNLVPHHAIVGGPHASALPERTMKECSDIDFLVYGEGDVTFPELVSAIENKKDISIVDGICFRKDGIIIKTKQRELIRDLDKLPFPAHDLIFDNGYAYVHRGMELGRKVVAVMSSRGCPWECNFCYKQIFGSRLRRRSPKNVVDEIEMLMTAYRVDDIQFVDDLFAVNRGWLAEFCDELRARQLKVHWKCLGRVDTLTKEDMAMMKEHGCYGIEFGGESGNNEILKDINKKITVSQVKKAFKDARSVGLITSAFFIFGHRLDTHETITQTMNLARDIKADFCGFAVLLPFPGTKVFLSLPEDIKYNWEVFQGYYSYSSPISMCAMEAKVLQRYGRQANIEYYGRIRYLVSNIILSKLPLKIKWYQLMLFCIYALKNLGLKITNKQIFRGRYK